MPAGETNKAYLDGLKMLARRELSEAQVRERLARRGHDPGAIDDAVRRLRDERAIDDVRAAEAIVRTEASVRRHGKRHVERHLERAGIDTATARRAVDEAFEALDEDAQIEAAIARRLHGRGIIADDRELQRLYRYLVAQGFDSERVQTVLTARKRRA
jgi:regulatory protein